MIAIEIPKINYTTITVTRRLSVDMPFADARMGAPYGEYNAPAIGVLGAIGTVSAGLAAKSAILGGILIAGGIASGLGAITGNKALSTFGAVAGLAGGAVGSFTSASTGGFINPFSSEAGQGFFNSVTGDAFKSVFDNIKGGLGITDATPANPIANDIKSAAGADVNSGFAPGSIGEEFKTKGAFSLDGQSPTAGGGASSTVKELGGGLLSTINNNQGLISALGGLGDGYMKGQELEQLQPLTDARVDGLEAQTEAQRQQIDLTNQRQQNLQFQPNSALEVNQNQQVYNREPGGSNAGKYAVAMNGTIKYVTQAEYDALRQAQGGSGMLAQGVA